MYFELNAMEFESTWFDFCGGLDQNSCRFRIKIKTYDIDDIDSSLFATHIHSHIRTLGRTYSSDIFFETNLSIGFPLESAGTRVLVRSTSICHITGLTR